MPIYEFSENNSGGSWWLDREQYDALFAAGWKYEPENETAQMKKPFLDETGSTVPWGWRHYLTFEADSIQDAVRSWEEATGENFFSGGCPCCGPPFNISSKDAPYEYASGGYEESPRPW